MGNEVLMARRDRAAGIARPRWGVEGVNQTRIAEQILTLETRRRASIWRTRQAQSPD
jgi:hypothetical protein